MVFHIKKENIHSFSTEVSTWFSTYAREYPWRQTRDPYFIWLSEVMLQQTQAPRVVSYYEALIERFPTVHDLAAASYDEFFPYYKGLGYYSRAKNMLKTAQIVVKEYKGFFPSDQKQLESLPGVGPYTAQAIRAFAFQQPVLAIDTNLKKVFSRFFLGEQKGEIPIQELEASLQPELPKLNGAIMDFANDICTRIPKCHICPLAEKCRANIIGLSFTSPSIKKEVFPEDHTAFVVLHTGFKKYYSLDPSVFRPFTFEGPGTKRSDIKRFFLEHYGIEVSVRPPRKKSVQKERGYMLIYAQIQTGEHSLFSYSSKEAVHVLEQSIHPIFL